MLKFNANLTQLYTEYDFLDRFAAAAADGFRGIEYRAAYHIPKEVLLEHLRQNGLEQVLFNLPLGNWDAGERGIACLPGREEEFRHGLEQAADYARTLGCPQLNCLAGLKPDGLKDEAAEETLCGNLRYAADRLAKDGIRLLVEILNRRDNPGCVISSVAKFEEIAGRVGSDNLFLQYDFYHLQVMQGDLIRNFERLQSRIAHVQVADNPGRHEPGTGEINYPFIFESLELLGYNGWIGCEYAPKDRTSAALGWMRAFVPQPERIG
ncbi:hydroxypyruvate isomerase family protein [Rhizobium sp. P32RR-XVIII]|uniref:2-oxo-tetronate isomerase n=1 Tax=Rhizobium sp. P32RR-XVIII TaxID=2726738 RepID=UPI00145749C1|nr:2-oxo-tetronate isomerase [Rhizobium sp. P32RR-XVIII]NLS03467.1 hydroxypyruvate isomerase family protein [Rhizobium sp. P32RR-XVIII]